MPTTPGGSEDVVRFRPGGLIVSDSAAVVDCDPLSATFKVKLLVPAAVGVPDIAPPEIFKPASRMPFN